jgi:hypothetical protein
MNEYYVYQYLREDGTPYYIGKGKGNRAWDKNHNINLPLDSDRIVVLQNGLTEQEAFELEINLIAKYGRKENGTGILRNLTDGGDGPSGVKRSKEFIDRVIEFHTGRKRSEETKKRVSQKLKGRIISEETKQKMSLAHKGKQKSEETKKRMSAARTGEKHHFFGKQLSEEIKRKISASLIGNNNRSGRVPDHKDR